VNKEGKTPEEVIAIVTTFSFMGKEEERG